MKWRNSKERQNLTTSTDASGSQCEEIKSQDSEMPTESNLENLEDKRSDFSPDVIQKNLT